MLCPHSVGNVLRPGQILRDGDAEVLETFHNGEICWFEIERVSGIAFIDLVMGRTLVFLLFRSGGQSRMPISLLSLVSKVLERIVHNQISLYLTSNKLLSNNQFGFRSGLSTQDALLILAVTNDWHQLLSKNTW